MNDAIKNVVKVSKWMKNGYLERDYEYLTKVGFIKSEYENPRLNLVISTIDKNKMYGGLSTAVKLYRYLAISRVSGNGYANYYDCRKY